MSVLTLTLIIAVGSVGSVIAVWTLCRWLRRIYKGPQDNATITARPLGETNEDWRERLAYEIVHGEGTAVGDYKETQLQEYLACSWYLAKGMIQRQWEPDAVNSNDTAIKTALLEAVFKCRCKTLDGTVDPDFWQRLCDFMASIGWMPGGGGPESMGFHFDPSAASAHVTVTNTILTRFGREPGECTPQPDIDSLWKWLMTLPIGPQGQRFIENAATVP